MTDVLVREWVVPRGVGGPKGDEVPAISLEWKVSRTQWFDRGHPGVILFERIIRCGLAYFAGQLSLSCVGISTRCWRLSAFTLTCAMWRCPGQHRSLKPSADRA